MVFACDLDAASASASFSESVDILPVISTLSAAAAFAAASFFSSSAMVFA